MGLHLGELGLAKNHWSNKRVLITGHTGFKGGWLSLWLAKLGANVTGISIEKKGVGSFYKEARLKEFLAAEYIEDILNKVAIENIIKVTKPQVIFHLAAQPIVSEGYRLPTETFETNIMGLVNLFEAVRANDECAAFINVTSDKCYQNNEYLHQHNETDQLGGSDPYSASKACAEIITNAYRDSFFRDKGVAVSSARAGNVIGGGDISKNRLIPDLLTALSKDNDFILRNPGAVRPWQHVLDPINGYIKLAEKMLSHSERFSKAWNFGPTNPGISVINLAKLLIQKAKSSRSIIVDAAKFKEASYLQLDSTQAKRELNWEAKLSTDEAIEWTLDWYDLSKNNGNMARFSVGQIQRYMGWKFED